MVIICQTKKVKLWCYNEIIMTNQFTFMDRYWPFFTNDKICNFLLPLGLTEL